MLKGGRGVDLPEILHTISFLLALPEFFPTVLRKFGRAVAPLPKIWRTRQGTGAGGFK